MTTERFTVMQSKAIDGMWSVFDNQSGWVWQGFTSHDAARRFKERLDGADEQEYKRLRRWKPNDERGAN